MEFVELNVESLGDGVDEFEASGGTLGSTHIFELFQIPFMVFSRVMAREVGGGDVRDSLGVDTNYLRSLAWVLESCSGESGYTFLASRSSCDARIEGMLGIPPCKLPPAHSFL